MMISNSSPAIILPLHEHALEQVDPRIIYSFADGNWKCDNCDKQSKMSRPYHCSQCSFDLCQHCVNGERTLAHEHPLFLVRTSQRFYPAQNGVWQCDICQKTSIELQQIHSYHCSCCDFDLCDSCFQDKSHPIHVHPLRLAEMRLVYPQTSGCWECDCCGSKGRLSDRFAYHCTLNAGCYFDCCLNCFREHQTPLHAHPLVRADSHVVYARFSGGWRCDNCGSVHKAPDDNKPWHCQICNFDLCNNCMSGERQDQGIDETGPQLRSFRSIDYSQAYNPWTQRELVPPEPMIAATSVSGKTITSPEAEHTDFNESNECIICLVEPKNATLIHGDTGHCCTCWTCAQVLKRRGDPCPICRAPIDHVIKQFNS